MTIAEVLQCKKSKSSNQNTVQAHCELHTNNLSVSPAVRYSCPSTQSLNMSKCIIIQRMSSTPTVFFVESINMFS